jgi:3-deoxy-7-phosphoheptulonate synthase
MDSVKRLRKELRKSDGELVHLIAARMGLTDEIGAEKSRLGLPVYHPDVEREVIKNAMKLGAELGISPSTVESVMRSIIAESRLRQEAARADGKPVKHDENMSWHLPSPLEFRNAIPRSRKASATVVKARKDIIKILEGKDERMLLILGPCSIHDPSEAKEYAEFVLGLQEKVDEKFLLVMRAYVEKSRSGKGWTGYLADPYLDGTGDVQEGIAASRKLLNSLGEMGVPVATEFISSFTPHYIGDLMSWAAVGARSSGSQMHRDMASGLEMPVGFKNGIDGTIDAAVGAMEYAAEGHTFLGADDSGMIGAVRTQGNRYCHLVLRGGEKPDYDARSIAKARKALLAAGLRPRLIVDCSHGNSGKVAKVQLAVFRDVMMQRRKNPDIIGAMLESSLKGGKQRLPDDLEGFDRRKLKRGVSVTDECLGWGETERVILEIIGK